MNKRIRNILIIVILISTISGSFYWFELRPINVRQGCFELYLDEDLSIEIKDEIYNYCIEVGGKKEMMEIIDKELESDN